MRYSNRLIFSIILIGLTKIVFCQSGDFLLKPDQFTFIHYPEDKITHSADSMLFEDLFYKLDSIMLYGKGKINIVHIGGSHIQADIYTQEIRKQLQLLQADMNGGRGFVFPYRMAQTNNPMNYGVSYTGKWQSCQNTQSNRTVALGLSGMAVYTCDKKTSITINPNKERDIQYITNRIRVFYSGGNYSVFVVQKDSVYSGTYDSIAGCSIFNIPDCKIIKLRILKNDTTNNPFILYGISMDNDDPGLVYNAIGVNGARLSSYLHCEYFTKHLAAIDPDLIIFSIGTNDGNTVDFDSTQYLLEYERLIEQTRNVLPGVPVLLTVPNDCFLHKKYVNPNTAKMRSIIINLARDQKCGVWDLYSIMGGFGSSQLWYNTGLMRGDKIHFNVDGYNLVGDLFVTAFLRDWEENLTMRKENYSILKSKIITK
jgi:hypothetical protein